MESFPRSFWSEFLPKSWLLLRKGYSFAFFKNDLIAGITVGIVSLPLAMAFAIATGLPPERGLYTAIIAGFLISLLGGSRLQIGGPTGAFVVVIYGILQRHGYEGLVLITLLAGLLLIVAGLTKLGNIITYIPYPLVTGFTSGIAVVLFSSQIKDFFGLKIHNLPAAFIPKWKALLAALPSFDPTTLALALGTLFFMLVLRRFAPKIPWGITTVALATIFCWALDLRVETIDSRFGGLPRTLPSLHAPDFSLLLTNFRSFLPDILTVAFLAGIESLLSAVIADGMAGTKHKPNCELCAQGVANMASVLFGGIPATGAIARTATNIKSGAKTPLAGMLHAVTILLIVLLFAPLVSHMPLAALAALIMIIAWNMSEVSHFRRLFKAPLGDILILLTTFLFTILIDITVAVALGMIVAAFVFVKRMGETSQILPHSSTGENHEEPLYNKTIPPGIEIYEIHGPFFFGIAESLKDLLSPLELPPKVLILRMRKVPFIDASAMHSLKEFHRKCQKSGTLLLLSGVPQKVLHKLHTFGILDLIPQDQIFPHLAAALLAAQKHLPQNRAET